MVAAKRNRHKAVRLRLPYGCQRRKQQHFAYHMR